LLSALLSHPDGLGIDLSAVGAMDSAGVQLLVALGRSLEKRGQALAITDTSAVVRDVLQVYGLTSLLGA
jgi:anti-anti-sigma factor